MTLAEISEKIGVVFPDEHSQIVIEGVASLAEAGPTDLAFYADPRYLRALKRTKAAAVLVPENFSEEIPVRKIHVPEPSALLAKILQVFLPSPIEWPREVHPASTVSPSAILGNDVCIQAGAVVEAGARIGDRCVIGANSYIGHNASVGADCFLHPCTVVGERCILGNRVILHAGVVIGSDGFGYEFRDGKQQKIPQAGIVQVDDDVEIGANTTVDRARFGKTHIMEGAKIDNLVQIGHNVVVGPHSILCSQVGISGSTRLGAFVTLAGKVGVSGHIEIGERAVVGALSGVAQNVPPGMICAGRPPLPMNEYKRNLFQLRNIAKLYERVAKLEKQSAASAQNSTE